MSRHKHSPLLVSFTIALLSAVLCSTSFCQTRYDIVIHGGRVLDAETSLDAVRDVGIRGHEIGAVSQQTLSGARVIDASGLVVAPGFIDLHQHDQSENGYRLKVMDGVTSALELEIGPPDVRKFLDQRRNGALINYGTSASHPWARAAAFGQPGVEGAFVPPTRAGTNDPATPE